MKHRSAWIAPSLLAILLTAGGIYASIKIMAWQWWLGYLLGLNAAAFLIYGYDKLISGGKRTRVPENLLHTLAILGATPAAAIAQNLWRHKTVKQSFRIRFYLIVALQALLAAACAIYLLRRYHTPLIP